MLAAVYHLQVYKSSRDNFSLDKFFLGTKKCTQSYGHKSSREYFPLTNLHKANLHWAIFQEIYFPVDKSIQGKILSGQSSEDTFSRGTASRDNFPYSTRHNFTTQSF